MPGASSANSYRPSMPVMPVRTPVGVCRTTVTPGSGAPPGSVTMPRIAARDVGDVDVVQQKRNRTNTRATRFMWASFNVCQRCAGPLPCRGSRRRRRSIERSGFWRHFGGELLQQRDLSGVVEVVLDDAVNHDVDGV